jgi:hypothetical protein
MGHLRVLDRFLFCDLKYQSTMNVDNGYCEKSDGNHILAGSQTSATKSRTYICLVRMNKSLRN